MKKLNQMRLLSGLPIDPSIEISEKEVVTEARAVPTRKRDLAQKDEKSLSQEIKSLNSAIKHIEQAIKALDKVPATSFKGNVQNFIQELEDILDEGEDSMKSYAGECETNLRKFKRDATAKARAEEEEAMDNISISEDEDSEAIKVDEGVDDLDEALEEAAHYYKDDYEEFETDDSKPINVSDGSSNGEQVFDEPMDSKNVKDESPTQLRTGDEKSEQDQSDGLDIEADMKIPAAIKKSLKDEIAEIKREAEKLDVSNKEASYFYHDMANAFEDLLGHLEKGTRYDFKLAQNYAQGLMGPMLHKLPADVWKFIANGGERRSLKDYMKPVDKKFPIEGPRNTIK